MVGNISKIEKSLIFGLVFFVAGMAMIILTAIVLDYMIFGLLLAAVLVVFGLVFMALGIKFKKEAGQTIDVNPLSLFSDFGKMFKKKNKEETIPKDRSTEYYVTESENGYGNPGDSYPNATFSEACPQHVAEPVFDEPVFPMQSESSVRQDVDAEIIPVTAPSKSVVEVRAPACGVRDTGEEPMRFCPYCGEKRANMAKSFCPNCGTRMEWHR